MHSSKSTFIKDCVVVFVLFVRVYPIVSGGSLSSIRTTSCVTLIPQFLLFHTRPQRKILEESLPSAPAAAFR